MSAASCLLLCVAVHQVNRAESQQLSSWKGGGFGMFATLDQTRFAKLYHRSATGVRPLAGPQDSTGIRHYRYALALPTEAHGHALLKHLSTAEQDATNGEVVVVAFQVEYLRQTPPQLRAVSMYGYSGSAAKQIQEFKWRW